MNDRELLEMAAIAFPLSSPFAMLARAAMEPQLWTHALALAWQALAVVVRGLALGELDGISRGDLHGVLAAKVPGRNFDYFLTQRGMFSYTNFTEQQVRLWAGQDAVWPQGVEIEKLEREWREK